jgi:hypothetical protein
MDTPTVSYTGVISTYVAVVTGNGGALTTVAGVTGFRSTQVVVTTVEWCVDTYFMYRVT